MKPSRGIFEYVCNRFSEIDNDNSDLESRLKKCGHVGDSESKDYWGAKHAGFGRAFLLKPNIEHHTQWPHHDRHCELFENLVPPEDVIFEIGQILDR